MTTSEHSTVTRKLNDTILTGWAAATLPARAAMQDAVTALGEHIRRLEEKCPKCGHLRVYHGDSDYGCVDCPTKFAHWWSAKAVPSCTWR